MISRFFKKKPKPAPAKKTVVKKKPSAEKPVKTLPKTPPKPSQEPLFEESPPPPSMPEIKPGKIITAEGWKRLMMRRFRNPSKK